MKTLFALVLMFAGALPLSACGKRFPPGIESELFAALATYADAVAPKCVELMSRPCFQGSQDQSPENVARPVVPEPVQLIGDRRLRYFGAYCSDDGNGSRAETDCSSRTTHRPPTDRERCSFREFKTGRIVNQREPGDYILTADETTCDYPWISVINVRRSAEGIRFLARANLLPASYLQVHPALSTLDADRPR